MEKRLNKLGWIEFTKVINTFSHTDETDRDFEFIAYCHHNPSLGGTIELGQRYPGNIGALLEEFCLGNGVLASRGIQNKQSFMGGPRDFPPQNPADFLHQFNEIRR